MSELLRAKSHTYPGKNSNLAGQFSGLREEWEGLRIEVKVEYATQKLWKN
jgi:hypothetical protein